MISIVGNFLCKINRIKLSTDFEALETSGCDSLL